MLNLNLQHEYADAQDIQDSSLPIFLFFFFSSEHSTHDTFLFSPSWAH